MRRKSENVLDVRAPSSNPTTEPSRLQRRVMYYNASWQLIEEHICDDWDDEEEEGETNRIGQLFWGLRYIDDLVFRREDRNLTNEPYPAEDPAEPDWEETETGAWYALNDVQFSVVAQMTPEGRIVERVVYDPYGRGRHYFPADYNGDGVVTTPDIFAHLSDWYAGHLSSDWNRVSDCDVPDIFAFQTDWFAHSAKNAGAGQISFRYIPGTSAGPDNPIGYCGYVFNPETDDYTVRFRHYDPEIGRWLERDPLGPVDGNNRYEYVKLSPVQRVDPLGLFSSVPRGDRMEEKTVMRCGPWAGMQASIQVGGSIFVDQATVTLLTVDIAGKNINGQGDSGTLAYIPLTNRNWKPLDGRFKGHDISGANCKKKATITLECCRNCDMFSECDYYKTASLYNASPWKWVRTERYSLGTPSTECKTVTLKVEVRGVLKWHSQGTVTSMGTVPYECDTSGDEASEIALAMLNGCSGLPRTPSVKPTFNGHYKLPKDGVGPPAPIKRGA